MSPRVVIVGAPGAGKTTVGTMVAERLGVSFHDTDHAVEDTAGKAISDIFVDDGEPAFRALEEAAVEAALGGQPGVVCLGGGAVLSAATRGKLTAAGVPVCWLVVSMPSAAKRVGLARDRPVLAMNPRAQLHALLAERTPLYAEVATLTVDTDDRTLDEVAADVVAGLS